MHNETMYAHDMHTDRTNIITSYKNRVRRDGMLGIRNVAIMWQWQWQATGNFLIDSFCILLIDSLTLSSFFGFGRLCIVNFHAHVCKQA